MSKIKVLSGISIVLSLLLAYVFVSAGFDKVSVNPLDTSLSTPFGYPHLFMYFIGIAELLGGIGLVFGGVLNKYLQRLAAGGLSIIMIGSGVSHLLYNPINKVTTSIILFVLLCTFIYIQGKIKKRV
jgi:uncharacterized membrane protein YphA (DoxX/SURF4 family)